jgi:hypothetical protein
VGILRATNNQLASRLLVFVSESVAGGY